MYKLTNLDDEFYLYAKERYSMNANSYVDELLMRAKPLIQEMLEPVKLPEFSFKVSRSIIITDVKGRY